MQRGGRHPASRKEAAASEGSDGRPAAEHGGAGRAQRGAAAMAAGGGGEQGGGRRSGARRAHGFGAEEKRAGRAADGPRRAGGDVGAGTPRGSAGEAGCDGGCVRRWENCSAAAGRIFRV